VDICDNVHRFGGMTGPKPTRPDPKDIEADQKKVADYIKEKQAQKDKELEESNKVAEDMLAKDLEEEKKVETLRKLTKEEVAAFDAENMAKLTRSAERFGFKMGAMP
jgi:secreted Zn-dependent insulinase-like peptidase